MPARAQLNLPAPSWARATAQCQGLVEEMRSDHAAVACDVASPLNDLVNVAVQDGHRAEASGILVAARYHPYPKPHSGYPAQRECAQTRMTGVLLFRWLHIILKPFELVGPQGSRPPALRSTTLTRTIKCAPL